MPLSIEEIDEIEKSQGGSGLRRKLEETIGENRQLAEKNRLYEATQVIGEKGLTLVKPEDLVGADDVVAKAEELQAVRQAERQAVIRDVLAQRGLEGEELDTAVAEWTSPQEGATAKVDNGIAELTGLKGQRPAAVRPETLSTNEKFLHAFQSKKK